jgi:hypothetical protein
MFGELRHCRHFVRCYPLLTFSTLQPAPPLGGRLDEAASVGRGQSRNCFLLCCLENKVVVSSFGEAYNADKGKGNMASCYQCGGKIPSGQEQRKWVHTGSSVGVSFGRRPVPSFRRYRGLRTICPNCANPPAQSRQVYSSGDISPFTWIGIAVLVFFMVMYALTH